MCLGCQICASDVANERTYLGNNRYRSVSILGQVRYRHGSGPRAGRCLEHRVQLIERLATLRADQKRHGQAVRPVDDQHSRQRMAGPRIAQLAAGARGSR
jgi:hypothetical protein